MASMSQHSVLLTLCPTRDFCYLIFQNKFYTLFKVRRTLLYWQCNNVGKTKLVGGCCADVLLSVGTDAPIL